MIKISNQDRINKQRLIIWISGFQDFRISGFQDLDFPKQLKL